MYEKYILIKLAKIKGKVDFFDAHKDILDQYGYVDFARISKGRICTNYIFDNFIFIKESASQGNRIFKAQVENVDLKCGEKYPEYYKSLNLSNAQWIRLSMLEVINTERFIKNYSLMNGKSLDGTFRGSVSWVFVKEK